MTIEQIFNNGKFIVDSVDYGKFEIPVKALLDKATVKEAVEDYKKSDEQELIWELEDLGWEQFLSGIEFKLVL